METLSNLPEIFNRLQIDFIIVVLVLCGGYGAKTYLEGWTHIRIGKWKPKFNMAWKTLICGSLLAAIYVSLLYLTEAFPPEVYVKSFYSYTFATCLYPFIKKPFHKFMNFIFQIKEGEGPREFDFPEEPEVRQVDPHGAIKTDL